MNDYSVRSYELMWIICAAGVFLIIAAIGMSLIADRSLRFAGSPNLNEEREGLIVRQKSQIVGLQHEHEMLQEELTKAQDLKIAHDAAIQTASNLDEVVNILASESGDLLAELSERQEEIEALEESFQKSRTETRNILWLRARNRVLNTGDLSKGVEFENATISEVDATGLLVRHRTGVVRIPVDRLTRKLREEFDLDPEEARLAMIELSARDAKGKAARKMTREKDETPVPTEAEILNRERAVLSTMRSKAANLYRLANESRAEAQRARGMDRNSRARSVPASLETWAQRAIRFERLGSHYSGRLAAALSKIREIDPTFDVQKR